MKISVIIPNYNDTRIVRALKSVKAQTYSNYQLIVVDGLSTLEEVQGIYQQYPIDHFICEEDSGIFDALNKGVKAANGDIIFLMGSDDYLPDEKTFDSVINKFQEDGTIDGVCIGCEFVNSNGTVIRKWYPKNISASKMIKGILPPHFSLFLKKEMYELTGLFKADEFNNVACDTIWLIDTALALPKLNIKMIRDKCLRMEYGGASTKSLESILTAFKMIHRYTRQRKLPFWFLISSVKAISKIFQLKLSFLFR